MSCLLQNNNVLFVGGQFCISEKIPSGIYSVCYDRNKNSFFLTKQKDKFVMPSDIWMEQKRKMELEYIKDSINKTSKNIGILFNGVKGTGKTLLAEMICNSIDCPVIMVENTDESTNREMLKFLVNEIKQNCVFLFDEFEKKFKPEEQQFLLSIVDGVHNTEHKKIFLFTCNDLNVDENFLGRLSRVAYILNFDYINDSEEIRKYLKQKLEELDDEQITFIVDFVMSKQNRTIDTLSYIVREVKNQGFEQFKSVGSKIMNLEDVLAECYVLEVDFYNNKRLNSDSVNKISMMSPKEFSKLCDMKYDIKDISENIRMLKCKLEEPKEKSDNVSLVTELKKLEEIQSMVNSVCFETYYCRCTEKTLRVGTLISANKNFEYDDDIYRIEEIEYIDKSVLMRVESVLGSKKKFIKADKFRKINPYTI